MTVYGREEPDVPNAIRFQKSGGRRALGRLQQCARDAGRPADGAAARYLEPAGCGGIGLNKAR